MQPAKGGGMQLPSIRSLHPYLPPLPPAAAGMPQVNLNPGHIGFENDERGDSEEPPKKRRRRQALSCSECKRRKIRCDRNQPCTPCKKRGDQAKCRWHVVEQVTERSVSLAEYEALRTRVSALETFVSHLPAEILASMPPVPAASSSSGATPTSPAGSPRSATQPLFFATSPPNVLRLPIQRENGAGNARPASPPSQGGEGRRMSAIGGGSDGSKWRELPMQSHAEHPQLQSRNQATSVGPQVIHRRYTYPHSRDALEQQATSPVPQTRHLQPASSERRRRSPSRSRPLVFTSPSSEWTVGLGAFSSLPPPFSSSYSSSGTSFSGSPPPLSASASSASASGSDGGHTSGNRHSGGNAVGRSAFRTHHAATAGFSSIGKGMPSTGFTEAVIHLGSENLGNSVSSPLSVSPAASFLGPLLSRDRLVSFYIPPSRMLPPTRHAPSSTHRDLMPISPAVHTTLVAHGPVVCPLPVAATSVQVGLHFKALQVRNPALVTQLLSPPLSLVPLSFSRRRPHRTYIMQKRELCTRPSLARPGRRRRRVQLPLRARGGRAWVRRRRPRFKRRCGRKSC